MRKPFSILIWLTVGMLGIQAVLIAALLFWSFWPYSPRLVYSNVPFPVQNAGGEVAAGDTLRYEISYCRYTDAPLTLVRELVGPVTYTLPVLISRFPKGCHSVIVERAVIPVLPSGEYTLHLSGWYNLNPIRTGRIEARTMPFTIKGLTVD